MRSFFYGLGGILLVAGAASPLFLPQYAPYVFTLGALLFCPAQLADRYEGRSIVVRRLRRQQVLGALFLLVTAALMLCSHFGVAPFRGHEWEITLLIAAVLEVYTVFRIAHEEEKELKSKP